MKKCASILIVITVFASVAQAQDVLSLEEALKRGLEKNKWITVSRNQLEIAKSQNNAGNAGMTPSVGLSSNFNFSSNNAHFEFNNGTTQDRNGAVSTNLGASLFANWVVFDGMRMFAVKKRLEQSEQLSALALKQQMENTVYKIIQAYYGVVKVNALIKSAQQTVRIAEERLKIANLKYAVGSDSKVDVLLARNAENTARSAVLQLELQLLAVKNELNVLIDNKPGTEFIPADSLVTNYNPAPEALKRSMSGNNLSVLFSKQSELINEQTVREARSGLLPQVQINGSYNFVRNASQAGFVFLNRQSGIGAGVSANWLFYSGGRNKRLVQERSVAALNQKLITEQTMLDVDALVLLHYRQFELNKKILELEQVNTKDAEELMEVSIERYRIGKAPLLETLEAQKNLQEARLAMVNALYALKMAETDLLKANGELVK